jgi:hypothetical protein
LTIVKFRWRTWWGKKAKGLSCDKNISGWGG